ncbi:MAG: hypothetical protein LQ345_002684 [Seirophora villosa]|nr:MAG: hypothetical protein LQ345_002684 [Seirophora villosa]
MAYRTRTRPSISIHMHSQIGSPTSPSALFHEAVSPNSWTARSFTTLRPSDSPSQAQFPKYSQASLLLKTRTTRSWPVQEPNQQPTTKSRGQQGSFLSRNFLFIALAALFHLSLIVATAMLVLIIASATSHPRKHIQPAYYIGVMLSFAAGLASIIAGYVKWQERKTHHPFTTGAAAAAAPPHLSIHAAERGFAPFALVPRSPIDDLQAVVNDWDPAPQNHHLRALLASRNNPVPSASARLAGSTNRPRTTMAAATAAHGIELESLNHQHQHHPPPRLPHPQHNEPPDLHHHHEPPKRSSPNDATLELRRFLDHELQRQELIKRRISTWLCSLPLPLDPNQFPFPFPLPPPPPPLFSPNDDDDDPTITRIPANPTRLAAIEAEIAAYLGAPPPPLPISDAHRRDLGLGIEVEGLPEARVREARGREREGVRSDPTTVVYVGPGRPPLSVREGVVGGEGREGGESEEVDDFAEKWIEEVVRGVEAGSSAEGASSADGGGNGSWSVGWKRRRRNGGSISSKGGSRGSRPSWRGEEEGRKCPWRGG